MEQHAFEIEVVDGVHKLLRALEQMKLNDAERGELYSTYLDGLNRSECRATPHVCARTRVSSPRRMRPRHPSHTRNNLTSQTRAVADQATLLVRGRLDREAAARSEAHAASARSEAHAAARRDAMAAEAEAAAEAARDAAGLSKEQLDRIESVIADTLYEHGDARRLFIHFDLLGNGRLTPEEFRRALNQLGVALTTAETEALVQRYDRDRSGTFDYEEFVAVYEDRARMASSYDADYMGGHRPPLADPSSFDIRPSEEQRLAELASAIRSKLSRQFGTATRAFLAINKSSRSSVVTARELKDELAAHGLRVRLDDVKKVMLPFTGGSHGLSVHDFQMFWQARGATPPATQVTPYHSGAARPPPPPRMAATAGTAPGGARPASATNPGADGFALFRHAIDHTADTLAPAPAPLGHTAPAGAAGAPLVSPMVASGATVGFPVAPATPAIDVDKVRKRVSDALYSHRGGVRANYKKMDVTRQGVSPMDFRRRLHQIGCDVTMDEVTALFAEHDLDHNGRLSFSEFLKMLASGQKK